MIVPYGDSDQGPTIRPIVPEDLAEDEAWLADIVYNYLIPIGKRMPKYEELIASDMGDISVAYARDVIKGPWPELEKNFLEYKDMLSSRNLDALWDYIAYARKKPWPEMEDVLKDWHDSDGESLYDKYVEYFNLA